VHDLKQQLESRNSEIRSLNSSLESLKGVNEELKVSQIQASLFLSFLAFKRGLRGI
jgi:hypothetical protein